VVGGAADVEAVLVVLATLPVAVAADGRVVVDLDIEGAADLAAAAGAGERRLSGDGPDVVLAPLLAADDVHAYERIRWSRISTAILWRTPPAVENYSGRGERPSGVTRMSRQREPGGTIVGARSRTAASSSGRERWTSRHESERSSYHWTLR